MSRIRLVFASLVFASACAVTGAAPPKPTLPVEPVAAQKQIDRAAVRAKLAERRAQTIEHFIGYREARVYPINNLPGGGFRHVWLDDFGNLCAAATLISYDWGRDATVRVGQKDRELQLARVTKGEVMDWMLTSGLTQGEIVAIQVPGFSGRRGIDFDEREPPRQAEINRLYGIYVDVERQLIGLHDHNLDLAVDALMAKPELARELLSGHTASAGKYALPPLGGRAPVASR